MRVIVSVPTCALRSKRFASALQMLADKLMPRPSSPSSSSSSKAAHLHTHPHQHASRLRMFACSEGNDYLGTGGGLIYALQRCYDAQQRSSAKSTSDTHKHDDVGATWLIKDDVDDDAPRPSATSSLLSTTWLQSEPRMVLLAGGQARRLPSYASLGKLLTPMPNNNSNNNNINCYSSISLMEAQLPLLLRLRHVAPRHLTTLVACGDVLLAHHRDGDALDESLVSALAAANTPYDEEDVHMKEKQDDDDHDHHHEAEVLCVALQRGANIATNHGVFFVDRRTRVLRYIKQKPTKEEIERCCSEDDADFFVDAGLWLLGDRAITYIQSQSMRHISSSSSSSYSDAEHNTTSASRWTYHNYDLFGSFGSMFGTHPASSPSTPSPPWRVRIIVLGEGVCTFHHVGTNLDLLRSTMELLRRKSWMAEILGKTSSSTQQQCDGSWRIISQHAVISPLCTQNQYAPPQLCAATSMCTCADAPSSLLPSWVESSWISRGWRITCGNIITGVPRNQWSITMAEHQCVAVLPLRPPPSCQTRDDVEWFAIRPYGLHDSFVAPRHTTTTSSVSSMDGIIFMNVPLSCWLQHHHLTIDDVLPISSSSSSSVIDLHHLRLFPCSCDVPKLGQLLRWMLELPTSSSSSSATHLNDVDEVPMTQTEQKQLAEVWRASPRISAADFSSATDVDRVLDQQVTMQEGADVLAALLRGDLDVAAAPSVNLLRAAADVVELAMPLPTWLLTQPPPPTTAASSSSSSSLLSTTVEMPPSVALAPSHLHMFASDVMQHVASSLANDDETASTSTPPTTPRRFSCSMIAAQDASMFHHRHAMDVLRTVVVNALPREGRVWPRRLSSPSSSPSSSLVVRCPARIDLAGGWTDTPPFSLLHGGCVLNTGICMNDTQPIHVRVDVLPQQPWIHVCSHDAHEELILSDYASIYTYATSLHTPFAIVKAALCLCGFHPTFADAPTRTLREQLMRDFDGHGLRLTMAANIPVGSGLGTSSIVAGAVLHALSSFTHLNWSTEDVCARVLALEQLLTTGGGWQDQFGGLMPGLKMVESCAGVHQRPRVRLLRHEVFSHPANASRCLLFFTGISRPASTILHEVVQNVLRHAPTQLDVLEEMQHVAHEMEAVINMTEDEVHPSQQLSRVGVLLRDSWRLNQRLSSRSSTTLVDAMLRAVDPWIDGAKLAGAGGGGFMLLIAKDDDDCVRMIRRTLTDMAADGYFVEMSVATKGIQHEWVRDATHLHTNG